MQKKKSNKYNLAHYFKNYFYIFLNKTPVPVIDLNQSSDGFEEEAFSHFSSTQQQQEGSADTTETSQEAAASSHEESFQAAIRRAISGSEIRKVASSNETKNSAAGKSKLLARYVLST